MALFIGLNPFEKASSQFDFSKKQESPATAAVCLNASPRFVAAFVIERHFGVAQTLTKIQRCVSAEIILLCEQ